LGEAKVSPFLFAYIKTLFYICLIKIPKAMSKRLDIISFLKENHNKCFSYKDIHTAVGGDYKETYNELLRLVRERIVSKVLPGLNGGRNFEYYID
jgi:hypothetical protein